MRREKVNEYLEELTSKAIAHVQSMEPREFHKQVLHQASSFFSFFFRLKGLFGLCCYGFGSTDIFLRFPMCRSLNCSGRR